MREAKLLLITPRCGDLYPYPPRARHVFLRHVVPPHQVAGQPIPRALLAPRLDASHAQRRACMAARTDARQQLQVRHGIVINGTHPVLTLLARKASMLSFLAPGPPLKSRLESRSGMASFGHGTGPGTCMYVGQRATSAATSKTASPDDNATLWQRGWGWGWGCAGVAVRNRAKSRHT